MAVRACLTSFARPIGRVGVPPETRYGGFSPLNIAFQQIVPTLSFGSNGL
jgi:hypothetical protein